MHTTCLFHLKLMHSNHVFSVHCSRKLLWYNGFEFWHKLSFCPSLNSCNISETCFDHRKELSHRFIWSFFCSCKVTNIESVWMGWSLANYGWLAQSTAPASSWHSEPNVQFNLGVFTLPKPRNNVIGNAFRPLKSGILAVSHILHICGLVFRV